MLWLLSSVFCHVSHFLSVVSKAWCMTDVRVAWRRVGPSRCRAVVVVDSYSMYSCKCMTAPDFPFPSGLAS
jgi:hypothetical protein